MTTEELIGHIQDKYDEYGYRVKEICLPNEWKDELGKIKYDGYKTEDGSVTLGECDINVLNSILLFPSQSRHLMVIVEVKK